MISLRIKFAEGLVKFLHVSRKDLLVCLGIKLSLFFFFRGPDQAWALVVVVFDLGVVTLEAGRSSLL